MSRFKSTSNSEIAVPPKSQLRAAVAAPFLAAYVAIILVVTLRQTPVTEGAASTVISKVLTVSHDAGVPAAFNFHALQFTANIAMFVPFGFLLALFLPRRALWLALLGAPMLSSAVEFAQQLFLTARTADVGDIIANTIGGVIGVALAAGFSALIYARDKRVVARAFHFAATSN